MRDHLLNIHIRKLNNQNVIKPQEENLLSFQTKLNKEFSGPELVLVLGFVQDLKEISNADQITKFIEDSQTRSYRKTFEDLMLFQLKNDIQTEYVSLKEALPENDIYPEEKIKKERHMEDANAKEILLESSSTSKKDLNLESYIIYSHISYFNSGKKTLSRSKK